MENNKECIELLSNTIKELYAIELIFSDFKANELNINYEDEKFIIPYENKRAYLKNILKCAYDNEKYFNRVYYMIIREAEKTLKNNSQKIDMLIFEFNNSSNNSYAFPPYTDSHSYSLSISHISMSGHSSNIFIYILYCLLSLVINKPLFASPNAS